MPFDFNHYYKCKCKFQFCKFTHTHTKRRYSQTLCWTYLDRFQLFKKKEKGKKQLPVETFLKIPIPKEIFFFLWIIWCLWGFPTASVVIYCLLKKCVNRCDADVQIQCSRHLQKDHWRLQMKALSLYSLPFLLTHIIWRGWQPGDCSKPICCLHVIWVRGCVSWRGTTGEHCITGQIGGPLSLYQKIRISESTREKIFDGSVASPVLLEDLWHFLEPRPNQIGPVSNAWICVRQASRVDSAAPAERESHPARRTGLCTRTVRAISDVSAVDKMKKCKHFLGSQSEGGGCICRLAVMTTPLHNDWKGVLEIVSCFFILFLQYEIFFFIVTRSWSHNNEIFSRNFNIQISLF